MPGNARFCPIEDRARKNEPTASPPDRNSSPGRELAPNNFDALVPIIPTPMTSYTQSIQNLMNELSRLPGIGMRSAERIAFHLLKEKPDDAMRLADAIRDVKTRIKHCSVCYHLPESDPCGIC